MASLNDSSMMSLWSMKLWSQGRSPLHSVEACWVGSAHPIKYQCVISAFYLNIQKEASRDCVRLKKKSIVTDFNRWGMGGGIILNLNLLRKNLPVGLSVCPSVSLSVCINYRVSLKNAPLWFRLHWRLYDDPKGWISVKNIVNHPSFCTYPF